MANKYLSGLKNSPTLKIFTVLIITLLLLIPAYKIESLIGERNTLHENVVKEIGSKWGAKQTVYGPILTLPYEELQNKNTPNEKIQIKYLQLLPETLVINGELIPSEKKRSIYKAILYRTDLSINSAFNLNALNGLGVDTASIVWNKAHLSIGITDPRGISGLNNFSVDGKPIEMSPGVSHTLDITDGIQTPLKVNAAGRLIEFTGTISLRGSEGLRFVPLGKTTKVHLASPWKNPKFSGSFLPENQETNTDGFEANWTILDFNRSFAQVWDQEIAYTQPWEFGVDLLDPVGIYQKTNRAVKYAFMIIALSFTFFFFFEILRRLRIHPIQYIIVGFALLIFYLLLLALSEQMSFGLSFLISATAIVGVVGYYFYFISRSVRITAVFSSLFAFVYGFIYIILNAEAYSLLIGSVGLFILIALVMHFTRNVDWYHTSVEPEESLARD